MTQTSLRESYINRLSNKIQKHMLVWKRKRKTIKDSHLIGKDVKYKDTSELEKIVGKKEIARKLDSMIPT